MKRRRTKDEIEMDEKARLITAPIERDFNQVLRESGIKTKIRIENLSESIAREEENKKFIQQSIKWGGLGLVVLILLVITYIKILPFILGLK